MTGGLFAIFDDIAMLLDDTAAMSKVAAKKTAAVLGDDLAVNAEKASGFHASRELPVLWAITKGSLVNKMIILPIAFLLSSFASWLIIPILLAGGVYLSFEGVEKIYEVLFHRHHKPHLSRDETEDASSFLEAEAKKIKSAIRTDFILSIEIIMIALGTVMTQTLITQFIVVSLIAMVATVGVYGFVALLVRMDDMGFYIIDHALFAGKYPEKTVKKFGQLLVTSLPKIIRLLGVVGTIAMLLVGGGMFIHNIHMIHDLLDFLPMLVAEFLMGILVGSIALGVKSLIPVKNNH